MSRSWYCKWRGGTLPPGAERRRRLAAEVKRLFEAHEGKYGSPRITDDLRDGGWRVSENTVAALMREQHLAARAKKKRRSTTRPGKGRWRAPDLVKRDFPAAKINQKWFGEGTEIATGEGKYPARITLTPRAVSTTASTAAARLRRTREEAPRLRAAGPPDRCCGRLPR